MSKKWINLQIYPARLTNDSRMKRASETVAELYPDCEVHMIGISNTPPHTIKLDEQRVIKHLTVKPLPIPKTMNVQFHLIWALKIFAMYLFKPVKLIQCHSVECLHIGVILKRLKPGAKLVYDPHELETEKNGLTPGMQKVVSRLEEQFIREADYVIPVGEKISEWYREKYDLKNVVTIMNMPNNPMKDFKAPASGGLREKYGIPTNDLIFIYQGAMMQHRNIDLLLDIFSELPPDRHMLFMGYGEFVPKIQEYATKYPNIHFLDAVPPDQILEYTSQCDVGLFICENTCLSYYYSLPNKFFEYLLAGLPAIVADFPEYNRYISKYDCGWLVPENSTKDFVKKFILSLDKEEIKEKKVNALEARRHIGWHLVKPKLEEIYLSLIPKN